MENLIDLIASDGSASDVSDTIKQLLYTKAAEKLDAIRPEVAASMFGVDNDSSDEEE